MSEDIDHQRRSIGRLVSLAERAVTKNPQRQLRDAGLGITVPQRRVLYIPLARGWSARMTLARFTGADKTAITHIIDGLVNRGLAVRSESSQDRRRRLIYLTDAGLGVKDLLLPLASKTAELAWAGISADHLEHCKRVLERIMDNLEE